MAQIRRSFSAALVGAASLAAMGAVPSGAVTAAPSAEAAHGVSAYVGPQDASVSQAELRSIVDGIRAKKSVAADEAVIVYYDDTQAPTFDSVIDQSAQIWNDRVNNVQMVERDGAGADLRYDEGNDPRGSYYRSDGYIFMDYAQNKRFNSLRVAAHELGHHLGLPDRRQQGCDKLMSGGAPGTSCTNPNPDAAEAAEVDALWG